MNEEIDAGEIILQKKLSLKGTLNEIFDRMIINDYEIIEKIIQGKYKIRKQSGRPTTFKRRQPYQSELKSLDFSKRYLYDFIRMLDNPYPNAFLSIGKRKIIFHNVKLKNNRLKMEAEII